MIDIEISKKNFIKKIFGIKKFEKWLRNYPILNNQDVEKWLLGKIDKYTDEGKNAKDFTIQNYLSILQKYCNYYEAVNPTELLKENIDKRNARLKKFLRFLLTTEENDPKIAEIGFKKKPNEVTVRNLLQSRIKSFYSARGSPISYNLKSKKTGENHREIILSKDIIRKIEKRLESRNYRLICKFESQTGLRISDIVDELTSGKYSFEKYMEHFFIRNFVTKKRMVTINYLFLTKELEDAIKSTMAIDDLTEIDLTMLFETRKGTRINRSDYLKRLKDITNDLKIAGNMKTHLFRKYFISAIGKATNELSDPRILTHFEAQEAGFNDQSYLRIIKDIAQFYFEWKKVEHYISVDYVPIDLTNEKVKTLEDKYNSLIQEVREKDKDIAEYKTVIEKLTDRMNALETSVKSNTEKTEQFNQDNAKFEKKILELKRKQK